MRNRDSLLKRSLGGQGGFHSEKAVCIIQSHAEHSQAATTGAADRLVINERRQRESEIDREEGKKE